MPTFATAFANGDTAYTVLSSVIKSFEVTKTDISVTGTGEEEVLVIKYTGTIDGITRQISEDRCGATAQAAADILVSDFD